MAEMTRYVFATPAKGIATGTKACGRCRVRYLLAIITTAFLLASLQGCVTETRRESALDSTGRGVSVELRRAITGIGYKGVLFTPLDTQGAVLLGWTPSAYDIARMESHLPQILPDAGPRLFASGSARPVPPCDPVRCSPSGGRRRSFRPRPLRSSRPSERRSPGRARDGARASTREAARSGRAPRSRRDARGPRGRSAHLKCSLIQ